MDNSKTPSYIYKIVPYSEASIPTPLPEALPVSDLDQKDGFIHLSTSKQIPGTLSRFFVSDERVFILRLEYKKVEGNIKWEDPKGKSPGGVGADNTYPHLYNGLRLGKDEIDSFQQWERGDESWGKAAEKAEKDGWFVY